MFNVFTAIRNIGKQRNTSNEIEVGDEVRIINVNNNVYGQSGVVKKTNRLTPYNIGVTLDLPGFSDYSNESWNLKEAKFMWIGEARELKIIKKGVKK